MTGQEIQDKLDALVEDLQTDGKGQTVQVSLRDNENNAFLYPLSSDANGVVDATQLANIQAFVDSLKTRADNYETEYAPVKAASESFRTARSVHQTLIDDAAAARTALANALEADVDYQNAKTALDNARSDQDYVTARDEYKTYNISENFGNISEAKGKYVVQ